MSSRSLRPSGRKIGVAALAASLGLAGLGLAASPASALPGFEFERLAGEDRIETAVDISQDTFATSDTALIARADLYPDALAGNYLAGAEQAPILLSHTDDVPAETLAELDRLNVTEVTLLGGTAALDESVVTELEAAGFTVGREAGTDRYKTAAEIATSQDAATIGEVDGLRTAILATGEKFPDALAGGPLAYAGNHPILLTPTATLGADAAGALDALDIEQVLILGGPAAVSAAAEAQVEALGIETQRLQGNTRYDTATAIAEFALTQGFSDEHANVATGQKFPDALTGGPHAGEELAPILLANEGNTTEACAYLTDHSDTLVDGHIYGGTAAVSAAAEAILEECAAGDTTGNQTFTGTPGLSLVEAGTVTQFSFTGITSSVVDIALIGCENITTDANGVSTFPNSSNPGGAGNVANLTGAATANDITVINGSATAEEQYASDVAVNNGTVTFTVTNGAPDCYVAVVFADADNDDNIDLGTNNQPTEAFGNSGDINVVPPEQADNAPVNTTVVQNSALANLFIGADGRTYYYDANDEFLLEAGTVDTVLTLEQFEARLSPGDGIVGTYRNAPANQSSFTLNDIAPAAPTNVVAKAPDGTNAGKPGIEVSFTESATASVASYQVFRATATPPAITGQATTCPAQTSGAYAQVGTVADGDGDADGDTFEYYDSSALPPATGQTQPQYCYYVVSVDAAGDTGPNSATSNTNTPFTGVAGDTSGAPEFISASATGTTVAVNYDEAIQAASTDADASNYAVTVTRGGVTTALTEVSTADTASDTVTITVSGIPGGAFVAGDVVVVTAQNGADGNTVLDVTNVAQPVGDAVQTTVA